MTKKKILVIGRHADMLQKVTGMLQQNGYTALGETGNDAAIALFKSERFDAVIIGGGVAGESRMLFHQLFPQLHPAIKIIDAHPQTVLNDLQAAFLA